MCYEMRRFEKRAEERKQLQKKQKTNPAIEDRAGYQKGATTEREDAEASS